MKSEYIRKMFRAFAKKDNGLFIDVAKEIIVEEERKNHIHLAKDLKNIISEVGGNGYINGNGNHKRIKKTIPIPRDNEKGFPLLEIKDSHHYSWDDLILDETTIAYLHQIIEEYTNKELLNSYGLQPKQKLLFCGPPGTGKTLSAYVISSLLDIPLVLVRFDSIISSFLGETGSNIKKIFDFISNGTWIVLFDEFDVIGKHRDDPHEHGEIKRVVNNFMQILDSYHGDSLLISITNHHQLLDSGLWRRFDEIIPYHLPTAKERKLLFEKGLRVVKKSPKLKIDKYIAITEGASSYDIISICKEAIRLMILGGKKEILVSIMDKAIKKYKIRKKLETHKNGK